MGVEFSAGIVGMLALGWLVDEGLGTKPWGMIVGAAMGIVGGGYNFFKQAQKMNRDASEAFRRDYPDRRSSTRRDAGRDGDRSEPE
jgi:F0F1-type ATP synthase assembly protein I